jgi:hypothetical protein
MGDAIIKRPLDQLRELVAQADAIYKTIPEAGDDKDENSPEFNEWMRVCDEIEALTGNDDQGFKTTMSDEELLQRWIGSGVQRLLEYRKEIDRQIEALAAKFNVSTDQIWATADSKYAEK